MQSVEEFLNEYFRVRAEYSAIPDENRGGVMDGFIASAYGTVVWIVEEGDVEEIVWVRSSESGAEVLTSARKGSGDCTWRNRYQLVAAGESWQIASIELECGVCEGTGKVNDSDCEVCKGKGWTLLGPE